ncbi:hypothetical protein D1914_02300 [Salmonella enterica]|nr:hypothetical protein [Salmonella enterica]ECE5794526.1 hypothetical protein [Salmonella enterica subsp. diarizonae]ECU9999172.1 hypothetical protein [Salmonella enterica subsp. diarizonae serovar 48:i:z]EAU3168288.1 hypothetical protein [Salmonella enterica]EAV0890088.1 hypothetical protein [Salmonella enterica]
METYINLYISPTAHQRLSQAVRGFCVLSAYQIAYFFVYRLRNFFLRSFRLGRIFADQDAQSFAQYETQSWQDLQACFLSSAQ